VQRINAPLLLSHQHTPASTSISWQIEASAAIGILITQPPAAFKLSH
jgi:hypothetical protein